MTSIPSAERRWLPRTWPRGSLLSALPEPALASLLALGRPHIYAAGDVMILEGDSSKQTVVLLDGVAKVTRTTANGRTALLAIRVGGDLVGEQAALEGTVRSATVTAAGPVHGRLLPREVFLDFLRQHADASLAVSRMMSERLREATRRTADYNGLSVPQRVARVLYELARRYGRLEGAEGGLVVDVELTQPEIAALSDATEPTVHRVMADLRKQGLIDTGYRRVTVLDHKALLSLADGSGRRT